MWLPFGPCVVVWTAAAAAAAGEEGREGGTPLFVVSKQQLLPQFDQAITKGGRVLVAAGELFAVQLALLGFLLAGVAGVNGGGVWYGACLEKQGP